jgi:hypothetical protein
MYLKKEVLHTQPIATYSNGKKSIWKIIGLVYPNKPDCVG